MIDENVYTSLLRCEPIMYRNLKIYPPTLKEILDNYGYEYYMTIMQPYSITLDFLDIKDSGLKLLSDILIPNIKYLFCLYQSLTILTKCDDVIHVKENNVNYLKLMFNISENDTTKTEYFTLTDDNFEEIAKIFRVINCLSVLESETPPQNLSERQLDIWTKLHNGRKRAKEKESIKLCDILNICEFAGKFHIPNSIYNEWSLWKIYKCYENICGDREYQDGLQIACVSGESEQISGEKHWQKRMIVHNKDK